MAKDIFFLSHQNSSGLNLDPRSFFLSPCIFTPGSHLFCSFPWDSCSCSEICLAVSCSWTNPVSLTAVAPFPWWQATAGLLPVCQQLSCWRAQPQLSGLGWQILNRGKNYFPQLPGYSLSTTGGFQKCSDYGPKLSLVPQIANVLTGL